MRTSLLALFVFTLFTAELLAQSASGPAAGASNDGPLFAPPVIDVPNVGNAPMPPPPATTQERKTPRLFRLPKPQASAARRGKAPPRTVNSPARYSMAAGDKRTTTPPLTDAPLAGTNANLEASSDKDPPPAKSTKSARKYGPVELFPKAKDSDRTGNPFSLRKPVLAW